MAKKTSKTAAPAVEEDGQDPNVIEGELGGDGNEDEPSLDDQAFEAFSAGVDGKDGEEGGDPAPAAAKEPAKPAAKPDAAKPPAKDEDGDDDGEPAKAEPDADVEKEITSLGIKNESAKERFRVLTGIAKERDQLAEKLAEVTGLGDERDVAKIIESVTAIRDQAADGYAFQQAIQKSGVQPEQFGALMGYAQLANSGDPEKMKTALTAIRAEYEDLARRMGEPIDGVYDPLSEHKDLLDKVNSGKLDREDALETARLRNATKQAGERVQKVEAAQQQNQQMTQAQQAGFNQVKELCAGYVASEPELYKALQPKLSERVRDIQAKHKPESWATETKLAYLELKTEALQATPVAKVPVKRTPAPARPGGSQVGDRVPRDDFDALSMGIDSAAG